MTRTFQIGEVQIGFQGEDQDLCAGVKFRSYLGFERYETLGEAL